MYAMVIGGVCIVAGILLKTLNRHDPANVSQV
jgi:hypothetical protein